MIGACFKSARVCVFLLMDQQIVQFLTMDLTDPEKDGRYEGIYSAFIYNGEYRITFYARNTKGNIITSSPTIFTVTGGQSTGTPGDINGNKSVNLTNAILAMQIAAGMNPSGTSITGDVNNDGRIGLAELIYILQKVAGIR